MAVKPIIAKVVEAIIVIVKLIVVIIIAVVVVVVVVGIMVFSVTATITKHFYNTNRNKIIEKKYFLYSFFFVFSSFIG